MSDIAESFLEAVFERVDWFSCNEREARLLTDCADARESACLLRARMHRGGAVVRVGANGCVVAESVDRSELVAGFHVTSVDTNGAGDTHVGAFAAALAKGQTPLDAARWANAAAAWSVTRRGPATGPTTEELKAFIASASS